MLIQFGGIGDTVLITPAIKALTKFFPQAKFTVLSARRHSCDFLLNFPNVVEVDELDIYALDMRKLFHPCFWQNLKKGVSIFRRRQYDLIVSFRYLPLIDWLFIQWLLIFLSRSKFRVGVNPDFLPNRSVYHRWLVQGSLSGKHYIDFYLRLIQLADVQIDERTTSFPLTGAAEATAAILLNDVPNGMPICCMHAGGYRLALEKELWPSENFTEIVHGVVTQGMFVVLIGALIEKDRSGMICSQNRNCLNLAGKTGLQEMAAIIKRADIFIGNDSGPFHIAAAVGTPAIGIFTRTVDEPEYYNYPMRNVFVFKSNYTEAPTVDGVLKKAFTILSI